MKEIIKTTSTLYECRNFAKELYKDDYSEKIIMFRDIILNYKKSMKKDGILDALTSILKLEATEENKLGTLMFCSAAIDLIEEQN